MESKKILKSLLLLIFFVLTVNVLAQENVVIGNKQLKDIDIWATNTLTFGAEEVNSALSLEHFLAGRVPGLLSQLSSGNMSEGGTLTIRGLRSLNANNEPLIILDGMIYERPVLTSIIGGYSENLL